jgi:hypothetical protein
VSQLCGLLEKYVRSRSFYVVPPQQAAKASPFFPLPFFRPTNSFLLFTTLLLLFYYY